MPRECAWRWLAHSNLASSRYARHARLSELAPHCTELATDEKTICVRAHQPDGADDFALAYAGLADTYVVMGGNGQKPLAEVVPRAKAALARALELDPDLAEAHATLALLHSEVSGERRGLEPELRRAVELSPGYASAHHWLGLILSTKGHFKEADAELRKAQILDPLSPMITEGVAENLYYWRRYDDAIEQVQRIRQMGSSLGDYTLGHAYVEKGMYQDAISVFSTLRPRSYAWRISSSGR